MRFKSILLVLFLTCLATWSSVYFLPDKNLHIVFCDVGQGDAILIWYKHIQVLVDAGPNNKVLDCLGKYMPFYDSRIEAILITHPHVDHTGGLKYVIDRYSVLHIVSVSAIKSKEIFDQFTSHVPFYSYVGDKLTFGPVSISTVWPSREYISGFRENGDLNTLSLVNLLTFSDFEILLTGDADHQVQLAQMDTGLLKDIDVLKVPHHGGKEAMLPAWLSLIKPELSVISAGKGNRYGHPRPESLDALRAIKTQILRTDEHGDVQVTTNGKTWWVSKPRGKI